MKKIKLIPGSKCFFQTSKIGKLSVITLVFMLFSFVSCNHDYQNNIFLESAKDEMAVTDCVIIGENESIVEFNTEDYDRIYENSFMDVIQNPLSTFSIDVDNASYSNIRRFLTGNQLPPKDAVRIEEMINYFQYDYPQPTGSDPFSVVKEMADCPWNKTHKLVHIGLQGKSLEYNDLRPSNLVFLIDVSGSMEDRNKLPLLKKSFKLLIDELSEKDKISIVVYAGAAGVVLPPTSADHDDDIIDALDNLAAGGSTAGGAGIELAYKLAKENLIQDGNNRVILATDGDFNVGPSSNGDMVRLIEEKRKDGIFLTILGFGMGNYKDSRMEQISNAGNGNYFYIDNIKEAEKVFVKEMRANMFTIAKDVKIQVEFNPKVVKAYRLIGYENRVMKSEEFNDDTKDAGELGAGHTVTALYEIIPSGSEEDVKRHDNLKYQETKVSGQAANGEVLTVKLRYKPLKSEESILISETLNQESHSMEHGSSNFRFSAAVAGFGMLLRDSEYKGDLTYDDVYKLGSGATDFDPNGYKEDFLKLVEIAKLLSE